jgi:hypothetical protein
MFLTLKFTDLNYAYFIFLLSFLLPTKVQVECGCLGWAYKGCQSRYNETILCETKCISHVFITFSPVDST